MSTGECSTVRMSVTLLCSVCWRATRVGVCLTWPATAGAATAAVSAAVSDRARTMVVGSVSMVFHANGSTPAQDTFRCGNCQTVLQRQNLSKHKPGTGIQCTRQAQRIASWHLRASEVSAVSGVGDSASVGMGTQHGPFGEFAVPGPDPGIFAQKRGRSTTQVTDATSPDICPHCRLSMTYPFCGVRGVPHHDHGDTDMEEDVGEAAAIARASTARGDGAVAPDLPVGAVPPRSSVSAAALRTIAALGRSSSPAPRAPEGPRKSTDNSSAMERILGQLAETQRLSIEAQRERRSAQDPSATFPVLWPMDVIRADAACCIQQAVLALAGGEPLPPAGDISDVASGPPMPRPGGWQTQSNLSAVRPGPDIPHHSVPFQSGVQMNVDRHWPASPPAPPPLQSPMQSSFLNQGSTVQLSGSLQNPGAAANPHPPASHGPGAGALLPGYMNGTGQDPPRASRDEMSRALAYAHQAGLKYSGGARHWVFDPCPAMGAGRAAPHPVSHAPAAPAPAPSTVSGFTAVPRTASAAWATGVPPRRAGSAERNCRFPGRAQYRFRPQLGLGSIAANDPPRLPLRSPIAPLISCAQPPSPHSYARRCDSRFATRASVCPGFSISFRTRQDTLSALRWAGNNIELPISPKLRIHDTIVRARPAVDSALQWLHPSSIPHIAIHERTGFTDDLCTCRSIFSFFHALRVSEACRGAGGRAGGASFALWTKRTRESDALRAQAHAHNLKYVERNTVQFWAEECLRRLFDHTADDRAQTPRDAGLPCTTALLHCSVLLLCSAALWDKRRYPRPVGVRFFEFYHNAARVRSASRPRPLSFLSAPLLCFAALGTGCFAGAGGWLPTPPTPFDSDSGSVPGASVSLRFVVPTTPLRTGSRCTGNTCEFVVKLT
eukprot:gene1138-biopygen4736